MNNIELEKLIDQKLAVHTFKDYAPNGLQVEGGSDVKRIVTGVTASQKLLDAALEHGADTIIVHHGYSGKRTGSGKGDEAHSPENLANQ